MSFMDVLRRLKDLWVETLIGVLLMMILGFGVFSSPWVGVGFTALCVGLFIWFYIVAWKDEI